MTDVSSPPSGPRPTVDDEAPEVSRRLTAAAAEVFAEKGYDGAGVAEIARRAGLTTGAIYSRFAGKAELLAAAIRTCTQDELDELFAEHAFEGRATDVLQTVGSHLVTRRSDPGRALLLEAFVAARRDPEVALVLRSHLEARAVRMAAVIEASRDSGAIDPELDTAAIVHFAHAVGLGFLLFEAVDASRPDPAHWDDLVARVVTSVAPTEPGPGTGNAQPQFVI